MFDLSHHQETQMGNGYDHYFQYQRNLHNIQKSTFLPMLCSRTSIKDVALSRLEDRSASFSKEDPLSPKIGCMGQVKRNNKIIGFPTTTTTTSHNNSNNKQLALTAKTSCNNFSVSDVKYFKLKRFFSAKNIATNSCNNNNTSFTVSSCRRSVRPKAAAAAGNENKEREVCIINIAQMDPPLPVIKRVPKPAADQEGDENNNSLWKRRSSGGALKSLDLQRIQIPRHQVEIQTVWCMQIEACIWPVLMDGVVQFINCVCVCVFKWHPSSIKITVLIMIICSALYMKLRLLINGHRSRDLNLMLYIWNWDYSLNLIVIDPTVWFVVCFLPAVAAIAICINWGSDQIKLSSQNKISGHMSHFSSYCM